MSEEIEVGIKLVSIFMVILIFQLCRYKFPHFSMHAFKGSLRSMGVNSSYFSFKCKHTKAEIEKYKEKQKVAFYFTLIIGIVIIGLYVLVSLFC